MTHLRQLAGRATRRVFVSAALVILASPAFAADGQKPSADSSASVTPSTAQSSSQTPPDFLIGRPRVMVGVRGGLFMASAGSDFFDDMVNLLTLEKSSFRTGTFSAEVAVNATSHLDVVLGLDMNKITRPSEDRFMEELLPNGTRVPVEQTTELSERNFFVSAKYSLLSRGSSVSRLAWIPRTVVPYVGAGAGYGNYELRQNGDFVDKRDLNNPNDDTIFSDTFRSEGWTPIVHAFGGTDIQLYRRLVLSLEGRYTWKTADLSSDYVGYEPIDLGGFRFGAGVHLAF